jgi:hypothetical protein
MILTKRYGTVLNDLKILPSNSINEGRMMMMRIELIDEDSPFYKNMFDDDDGKEQNIIISNHQKRWINLIDLKKEN